MPTWNGIDVDDLRRRWLDGWRADEIARYAGCPESTVYVLRQKFRWPNPLASNEPPPPSVEDATLSEDSLALSPWVAKRAAQVRARRLAVPDLEQLAGSSSAP